MGVDFIHHISQVKHTLLFSSLATQPQRDIQHYTINHVTLLHLYFSSNVDDLMLVAIFRC